MSASDPSTAPAKRRWVKPLLVVSLALNLLFVGLVAGAFWRHGFGGWSAPKGKILAVSIEQLITELPSEKRKKAEDVLSRLRSDLLPRARDRQQARKRAIEALTADPFNEEKFRDALANVRTIRNDSEKARHDIATELVRELSTDERKRLLEIFRSKKRQHRRRWRSKPENGRR
ncbi:MAG: periplasmic heavy metal sensor [Methyloligellaceae bacterium]